MKKMSLITSKLLFLMAIIFLATCSGTASDAVSEPEYDYDSEVDATYFYGWKYIDEERHNIAITSYYRKGGMADIPAEIDGLPVTVIENYAFSSKDLTGVIIPDSVTTIGDYAFTNNVLTSAIIGNSVAVIGEAAFAGVKSYSYSIVNQLESIIIPNSVIVIKRSAFSGNLLKSVTIPDSVISIEASAFSGNKITEVIIGNGVNLIEMMAFYNNLLTNVIIGNGVDTIKESAFADNRLETIVIPDNVAFMGRGAVGGNPLTSITIGANVITESENRSFEDDYCFNSFITAYNDTYNKAAGTYTRPDTESTEWEKVE